MSTIFLRSISAVFIITLLVTSSAFAQRQAVNITTATISFDDGIITIVGESFDIGPNPTEVFLGGIKLNIQSNNGNTIVADLPDNLASGQYDLLVKSGPGPRKMDNETITVGEQGPQGEQGDQGDQGEQGDQGAQGPPGPQGPSGPQGPQGDTGAQGPPGQPGNQGPAGPPGAQGDPGPKGDQGDPGNDGADGQDGADGADGEQGPPGEKGDQGDPGNDGADGQDGADGADGEQGPPGEKGDQGDQGDPGEKGDQGDPGEKGDQGDPGEKGDQGDPGEKGDEGPAGADGADGAQGSGVHVVLLNENFDCDQMSVEILPGKQYQVLRDFNNNGIVDGLDGNAEITRFEICDGIQGETGPAGPAGADGATGAAGPQGPIGLTGPAGPQGLQGPPGTSANLNRILVEKNPAVFDPLNPPCDGNGFDVYVIGIDDDNSGDINEPGEFVGDPIIVCNPAWERKSLQETVFNFSEYSQEIDCSANKVVLGGGCQHNTELVYTVENRPNGNTGWKCLYRRIPGIGGPNPIVVMTVNVMCADLD